jgi:hypothetical protein
VPPRGFEPDAPSANKPRPHPRRIEYENQVGPGIIQELVVCLDSKWTATGGGADSFCWSAASPRADARHNRYRSARGILFRAPRISGDHVSWRRSAPAHISRLRTAVTWTSCSVGLWLPVGARHAIDVTVPPAAIAIVVTTQASFTCEPNTLECTLLSDVLDLGAAPDAMARCRCEQVVDQLTLRITARTLASKLRCEQDSDLPNPGAAAFVLSPVDATHERVVVDQRDHKAIRTLAKQAILMPTAPPCLG